MYLMSNAKSNEYITIRIDKTVAKDAVDTCISVERLRHSGPQNSDGVVGLTDVSAFVEDGRGL